MQQQLVSLGQSLGQRKADTNLPEKISLEKAGIADRKEVMAFVGIGQPTRAPEYSKVLKGLAEQRVEGVWLTGFRLAPSAIELRGRLLDPALLPVYINRLNADTVFFGRRFSAHEMKGVDPVAEKAPDSKIEAKPVVGRRYTEFVLHGLDPGGENPMNAIKQQWLKQRALFMLTRRALNCLCRTDLCTADAGRCLGA
jgi:hypothetical protein